MLSINDVTISVSHIASHDKKSYLPPLTSDLLRLKLSVTSNPDCDKGLDYRQTNIQLLKIKNKKFRKKCKNVKCKKICQEDSDNVAAMSQSVRNDGGDARSGRSSLQLQPPLQL